MSSETQAHGVASAPAAETLASLRGLRVCMAYRGRLKYASRLLQEIEALQRAGVEVMVLGQQPLCGESVESVEVVCSNPVPHEASALRSRPLRIAVNLFRAARTKRSVEREMSQLIRHRGVDLLWLIDWPMLRLYGDVAASHGVPVVYETLDLVAEQTEDVAERVRELQREMKAVASVDGIVVAGETFSEYYASRCEAADLRITPVVCENVPESRVPEIRPTSTPIRMVFLGALTKNRNLLNLVRAMTQTTTDVTLALQGEDLLGGELRRQIEASGASARVSVLEPVGPGEITAAAAQYDIGIISLEPVSLNEELAPTTKLYTYMAAGLAILGPRLPGVSSVVDACGNGWLVDGVEPGDWAKVIDEIACLSPSEVDERKRRSLDEIARRSWAVQESRFLGEFARVIESRGRRRQS